MDESIQIFDNFFDKEKIEKIKKYIENKAYLCNCYSQHNTDIDHDVPYFRCDLIKDVFFSVYLKDIIKNSMKIEYELERVYIIAQCYAQYSNYHFDNLHGTTVCLYITDECSTEESGGHIFFKIPDKKYIIKIEPKFNRLVVFPANYIHRGSGQSNNNIRYCIAWKFG